MMMCPVIYDECDADDAVQSPLPLLLTIPCPRDIKTLWKSVGSVRIEQDGQRRGCHDDGPQRCDDYDCDGGDGDYGGVLGFLCEDEFEYARGDEFEYGRGEWYDDGLDGLDASGGCGSVGAGDYNM